MPKLTIEVEEDILEDLEEVASWIGSSLTEYVENMLRGRVWMERGSSRSCSRSLPSDKNRRRECLEVGHGKMG